MRQMKYSWGLLILYVLLCGQKVSEVDYRGPQATLQISAKRMSPAFAALEDIYPNAQYLDQNTSKVIPTEKIKSGAPIVKRIHVSPIKIASHDPKLPINNAIKKIHEAIIKNTVIAHHQHDSGGFSPLSTALNEKVFFKPQVFSSAIGHNKGVNSLNVENSKTINVGGTDILIGGPLSLGLSSSPNDLNEKFAAATESEIEFGRGPIISASAFEPKRKPQSLINLKGQIILSDGAVYPGESFHFYLQRTFDGMTQERGKVNPLTGTFEISVADARGQLSVELRHETGAVIAYGDIKLTTSKVAAELNLHLYPTEQTSLIGQVLSYETFEDFEIAAKDVESGLPTSSELYIEGDSDFIETTQDGHFSQDHLYVGSELLVTAAHKGFWNSLQMAEAGRPFKPILYSQKHMQAFTNLIEEFLPRSEVQSVIWGRVSHNGQPLKGAKVMLQGFEHLQPLYFSLRIPNPTLDQTSEDGFFAFVNPPEGLHLVKTIHKNLNLPLESVVVKRNHTSKLQVESAPLKPVFVQAVDHFNKSRSIDARISIPGSSSSWNLTANKVNEFSFYDRPTIMAMDIDAGQGYINARLFVNRRREVLQIPLVQKNWLNSIIGQAKINIAPRTGIIIGLNEGPAHQVQVGELSNLTQVIYFNQQGYVTNRPSGQGGGFIIVNAPEGITNLSLKDSHGHKTLKKIAHVEHGRVGLITINSFEN